MKHKIVVAGLISLPLVTFAVTQIYVLALFTFFSAAPAFSQPIPAPGCLISGCTFTGPLALSDSGTTLITTSTTIPATYQIALFDSTGGALSETIQACNSGSKWDQTFKDATGKAATNNITLSPSAGNIDGVSTYVMKTAWQSVSLHSNGSACYVY